MRHNFPKRSSRGLLETFDIAYIDLPEEAHAARLIVVPMKTIFINIAAAPGENVDRLFQDVEDAEEFFQQWDGRRR